MIKKTFGRIGWRMLANIATLVPYLAVLLLAGVFAQSLLQEMPLYGELVNLAAYLSCTLCFGFTFYRFYFLKNDDFKFFCKDEMRAGATDREIMVRHLRQYGRIDAIWLSVLALLIAVMPQVIANTLSLAYAPAILFLAYIPIKIIAALAWLLFVAATYVVCLRFYVRRVRREREKNMS